MGQGRTVGAQLARAQLDTSATLEGEVPVVDDPVLLGENSADAAGGDPITDDLVVTLSRALGANALGLLGVAVTGVTTDTSTTPPTVTGGGVIWVEQDSVNLVNAGDASSTLYVFRALGASPSGTSITIGYNGPGYVAMVAQVLETGSVVTTGTSGADAIVQSVAVSPGTSADPVANMDTLADTENNAFVAFGSYWRSANANRTFEPDPDFAEISEILAHSDGAHATAIQSQYVVGLATTDPDVTFSRSGSTDRTGIVVLEIAAAGESDGTAPTLSSPNASATGQTTADLSVDTDEEADVYVVVTTSSTTPTAEQVEAGQDHTGAAAAYSDSVAGASVGTVNFDPATGLDPDTEYWAHFWAEDEAENSATPVTSSSFTTDAVPTLTAEGADLEMQGGEITLAHVTEGRVASTVSLGGEPVEGATVRLYNQTDDTYEGDTTTDESGAYAFPGLALAKTYHAVVEYEADGVLYHAPSQPGLRPVAD